MRKFAIFAAFAVAFVGAAHAQELQLSPQDLAQASLLMQKAEGADAAAAAQVADVDAIGIVLSVKGAQPGPGNRGAQAQTVLDPSDPEFQTVLDAVKAAAVRKAADATGKLKAMGLAPKAKPATPAAPVTPGGPPK